MAKEIRPINGRVVAITGAARGIGRATAQALIRRGAKVAIGDVDAATAEQTASELGAGTVAFELDVTSRQSFENFVAQVEERVGPIDVLINNAGIMPVGPLLEETDDTARRIIDIDVHGVIFGTKIAMERMVPRGTGHIVNIASQAGKGGFPGVATYCAAKHAVVGFSEAARAELFETGVEVSCVMPAFVNTELISGLESARGVKNAEPEDVAEAIVGALERPHFDVHVPKSVAYIGKVMMLLPRGGREAVAKALKADKVMVELDQAGRAAYEERISHNAPASDAAHEAAVEADAEEQATSKS